MSFTVFLGNLPTWVTKDDIKSWLASENLVADDVKVIRNPETQESKGFAFIESPNQEEMNAIIRRFDRAPLEDRLLRANPAQPPKSGSKGGVRNNSTPAVDRTKRPFQPASGPSAQAQARRNNNNNTNRKPTSTQGGQSAFAEELAKAL
jgi:RNA recognition motif-containing protein